MGGKQRHAHSLIFALVFTLISEIGRSELLTDEEHGGAVPYCYYPR